MSLREASQVNSKSRNDVSQSIDEVALYYQATAVRRRKGYMALDLNRPLIIVPAIQMETSQVQAFLRHKIKRSFKMSREMCTKC